MSLSKMKPYERTAEKDCDAKVHYSLAKGFERQDAARPEYLMHFESCLEDLMTAENKTDQALIRAGVQFLPWIGRRYEDGYGSTSHRLLVLGESHYAWEEGQKLSKSITRKLIPGVIAREAWVNNFFYFIEQTLLNAERSEVKATSGEAFWNSIAFYNFVQSQVDGGARRRPLRSQWIDAVTPFHAVLTKLKPDRVWVLGKTLWDWLPQGEESLRRNSHLEGHRLSGGHVAWFYGTRHPSSGFSWKTHHKEVSEFVRVRKL
jgi:hypothetical protein